MCSSPRIRDIPFKTSGTIPPSEANQLAAPEPTILETAELRPIAFGELDISWDTSWAYEGF